MYCTCSFSAEPSPTTASFIWRGVYSPTARPPSAQATSAAPRAWPVAKAAVATAGAEGAAGTSGAKGAQAQLVDADQDKVAPAAGTPDATVTEGERASRTAADGRTDAKDGE